MVGRATVIKFTKEHKKRKQNDCFKKITITKGLQVINEANHDTLDSFI
ncbi:MAG: hypothetical protein K0T53_00570 [Wolbachia pipientis]|nr:hypothetical protein [Wolbachia pipientis]